MQIKSINPFYIYKRLTTTLSILRHNSCYGKD